MSKTSSAILVFALVFSGCAGYYDTVDISKTQAVTSARLVGDQLTLKHDAILIRQRWEQYSMLSLPPHEPDPTNHYRLTGHLAKGTSLCVVVVQHQVVCDGFWQWPQDTAVARVTSGPRIGLKVVVGESQDGNWNHVLDLDMFDVVPPAVK